MPRFRSRGQMLAHVSENHNYKTLKIELNLHLPCAVDGQSWQDSSELEHRRFKEDLC